MDASTEQYLTNSLDAFSREQMRLLQEIKGSKEASDEKALQKQLSQLNAIVTALMRLRNIRRQASKDC